MEIELMYLTHSVSINDNYWIANDKELGRIKYENISIFKNSFNNAMYLIALTGNDGFTISENDISAEYTGQGTFAKCFKRENNSIYMFKSGSNKNISNEIVSGYIAQILGFKSASYTYEELFGVSCTKSKILSDESVNWETAFILCESMEQRGFIPQSFMIQYFTQSYSNMVIFDAIVLNEDRHMKNWAIEIDSNTHKILGLAPSFDYNNTFIADSHSMSNLLFDGQRKMNILKAGRESYRLYGTTLNLELLYNKAESLNIPINKISLKKRIEYITGNRDNQRGCYE